MADYSNSVGAPTAAFPVDAVEGQEWSRVENLITPTQLQLRFLAGIPLRSFLPDPVSKKYWEFTPEDLQDFILRAVSMVELDTGIYIFPVQFNERKPLDKAELDSWGYFTVNNKPILSVDSITIQPQSSSVLWNLPTSWVADGLFNRGQINIIPLVPDNSVDFVQGAAGNGAIFMLSMLNSAWISQYWAIKYTAGMPNGRIPRVVNELVGIYAAQELLSIIGTTNRVNSASTGMDGMSQSTGTNGPNIYDPRIKLLEDRKIKITQKLKAIYNLKYIRSNI